MSPKKDWGLRIFSGFGSLAGEEQVRCVDDGVVVALLFPLFLLSQPLSLDLRDSWVLVAREESPGVVRD